MELFRTRCVSFSFVFLLCLGAQTVWISEAMSGARTQQKLPPKITHPKLNEYHQNVHRAEQVQIQRAENQKLTEEAKMHDELLKKQHKELRKMQKKHQNNPEMADQIETVLGAHNSYFRKHHT